MTGLMSSGSSVSLPVPLAACGEASRHRWLMSRFMLLVSYLLAWTR